ncbi:MAG: hypothetical protein AAF492_19315, partial [Verrucomicrobiota bacterium]
RVEEYRKPEFEVTVEAPPEPARLGDRIEATVKARYYFGAPVVDAQVKWTVRRHDHNTHWTPPGTWDWFYGSGYGWFGSVFDGYPGWRRWGMTSPSWFGARPPEIVQEKSVDIGPDGTVKIGLNTAAAKALYGDSDHRYEITAEVIDASRRTMVGRGSVIAAREPYRVHVWLNGGHYRVGDEVEASIQARTADGKPVAGRGEATLYRVTWNEEGEPVEERIDAWPFEANESGSATVPLQAHAEGQYRISCVLNDARGREEEGAALVTIRGKGFDGTGFRFDDLSLTLDKAEYRPGDRVKLLVSTARKKSTVMLFLRPVQGVYPKPIVLDLKGGGMVREIDITRSDMPNIHVEAFTVSGGRIYNVAKKIVVPPEQRILTVDVEPAASRYQPGETGEVKIRLTDAEGKPFQGQTVVTVYDRSLESIQKHQARDIKAAFWRWERQHWPRSGDSLSRFFGERLRRREMGMQTIGFFGREVFRRSRGPYSTTKSPWATAASYRFSWGVDNGGAGVDQWFEQGATEQVQPWDTDKATMDIPEAS